MFDGTNNINVQKLGFNVGTAFESFAGNLLQILAEGIYAIFKLAGKLKLFRSNLFVYIYADKLEELAYKLYVRKKAFHILGFKAHFLFN